MTLYRYTVTGGHAFPIDMLRSDSCWPSRQVDIPLPGRGGGTVEIVSIKRPTRGRWASFGWTVSERVTEIKS